MALNDNEFTIHQVPGRIALITIVAYPDKILILDTGSKKDYQLIEAFFVDHLKRTMEAVKLIAVSHAHPDHSAGVFAFRKKFSLKIAGHPDIDKWYQGFGGRMQQMADVFFSHIAATQAGVPTHRFWFRGRTRPDFLLADNAPLPFFEDWRAIHTPGHTANHLVFYHACSQTLYVGDLLVKIHGKYHLPYGIPLPDRMRSSLEKIAALEIRTLVLPHGGIDTITDIRQVIEPLFAELDQGPGFPVELLMPLTRLSPEIRKSRRQP